LAVIRSTANYKGKEKANMVNDVTVVEEKKWQYFLSESEEELLAECEKVVTQFRESGLEAGKALATIRDERLYRQSHKTFEAYCRDRWDMGRDNADHLIGWAKVHENLPTTVGKPATESQARPLTSLEPGQQVVAWNKAIELAGEEKVTAKIVAKAVKEITHPVVQEIVQPESQKETKEDSEALVQLKRWWKKANAKDRRSFLRTIENDAPKGFHIEYRQDEDPDFKKLMAEDKESRRAALKRSRAGVFTEPAPEEESIISDMRVVLSDLDLTEWAKDELWNDDSLADLEWRKTENENLFTVAWEREFDENYQVEG
jgi:hypothetical protein